MKKFYLFFAFIAVVAFGAACNEIPDGDKQQGEKACVTVKLMSTATKATIEDTADEAKVSSIQVFVFNGEAIDGYKAAAAAEVSALSVSVDATAGTRDIWAFINAPALTGFSSKTEVLNAVSHFADNAADNFVMAGHLDQQAISAASQVNISVDRFAARFRLLKVTRRMTNAALQAVDFEIVRVYLRSVVTNVKYDFGAPTPYEWISKSFGPVSGRTLATDNPLVYRDLGTPAPVAQGASYENVIALYAYPNTHAVDDTPEDREQQTFRRTRLCVDIRIDVDGNGTFSDDEYFTYPVSVGAVESNKSYEIVELIITRLGNKDGKDDDITSIAFDVNLVVNDWTEVLVGDGGVFTI